MLSHVSPSLENRLDLESGGNREPINIDGHVDIFCFFGFFVAEVAVVGRMAPDRSLYMRTMRRCKGSPALGAALS